jgi:hypothetical protein
MKMRRGGLGPWRRQWWWIGSRMMGRGGGGHVGAAHTCNFILYVLNAFPTNTWIGSWMSLFNWSTKLIYVGSASLGSFSISLTTSDFIQGDVLAREWEIIGTMRRALRVFSDPQSHTACVRLSTSPSSPFLRANRLYCRGHPRPKLPNLPGSRHASPPSNRWDYRKMNGESCKMSFHR